ncbi:hypothetical protein LPJ66_011077, partial [Kickxella alabastrina]
QQLSQQHMPRPQRSPLSLQQLLPQSQHQAQAQSQLMAQHQHQQQQHQQQQQHRFYENGRYQYDAANRPATANLPMVHIPSPLGSGPLSVAYSQMPNSASSAVGVNIAGATVGSTVMPSISESNDTTIPFQQTSHTNSREELEWLQFNLRREELDFRKNVFAHEQGLESQRAILEAQRLEIQKREMELEARRVEMQRKQMDIQLESIKSLSTMLSQMVGQIGSFLGGVRLVPDGASNNISSSRRQNTEVTAADEGESLE